MVLVAASQPLTVCVSFPYGPAEEPRFSECGKRDDRVPDVRRLRIVNGVPGNSPWTVSLRDR